MMRLKRIIAGLLLGPGLLAGCGGPEPVRTVPTPPTSAATSGPDIRTDPTAIHLHDMAGQLLLYIAGQRTLPATLAQAPAPEGQDPATFWSDPVTCEPFVYVPTGPAVPGLPGRLVVYQKTPTHSRGRWTLFVDGHLATGRVVMYVQYVPETALQQALMAAQDLPQDAPSATPDNR